MHEESAEFPGTEAGPRHEKISQAEYEQPCLTNGNAHRIALDAHRGRGERPGKAPPEGLGRPRSSAG
jgi:hypothetical protein